MGYLEEIYKATFDDVWKCVLQKLEVAFKDSLFISLYSQTGSISNGWVGD